MYDQYEAKIRAENLLCFNLMGSPGTEKQSGVLSARARVYKPKTKLTLIAAVKS